MTKQEIEENIRDIRRTLRTPEFLEALTKTMGECSANSERLMKLTEPTDELLRRRFTI